MKRLRAFVQPRLLHSPATAAVVAMLRAGPVASMLIGITVSRRIVGVPVLAEAKMDALIVALAPAVQLVLAKR